MLFFDITFIVLQGKCIKSNVIMDFLINSFTEVTKAFLTVEVADLLRFRWFLRATLGSLPVATKKMREVKVLQSNF